MAGATLYAVYFNRAGADRSRAWIVRYPGGCERYFSHVRLRGAVADTHYRPRNRPPVPMGWLAVRGHLVVEDGSMGRVAVIYG